ncbi:MAG: hypothetical protein QXW13_00180 [Nanopusillaceae archaeon]
MRASELNILLLILLLLFSVGITGIVFLSTIMERRVEYKIPIKINETEYSITSDRYLFLYYSSMKHYLVKKNIENIAKAYNFDLFEYDIENPWIEIRFLENKSLPLILPLPIPSLLCVNNNTIYMLAEDALFDKENILLLIETCK